MIANTVATSEEQYAGVVEEEPEIDFEYIEDDNIDKDNVTVFTTRNTAQGLVFAEKDMDCKNAFEFIALAIRHNAIIEARSSLFHQEDLSFTAEQLHSSIIYLIMRCQQRAAEARLAYRIIRSFIAYINFTYFLLLSLAAGCGRC